MLEVALVPVVQAAAWMVGLEVTMAEVGNVLGLLSLAAALVGVMMMRMLAAKLGFLLAGAEGLAPVGLRGAGLVFGQVGAGELVKAQYQVAQVVVRVALALCLPLISFFSPCISAQSASCCPSLLSGTPPS